MKKILLLVCLSVFLPVLVQPASASVLITVDAQVDRHPIDPRIYGLNYAEPLALQDLRTVLNRQGGNNTSRYNWTIDADNRGSDYYFLSVSLSDAGTPGRQIDSFIEATKGAGAEPMITIPMLDWVAKLGPSRAWKWSFDTGKYGAQCDTAPGFPSAGNGESAALDCANVTGNDPNDANVPAGGAFQQGLVDHLVSTWGGAAAPGGLRYYILDNEHSIWFLTHRDVHPQGPSMEEIRNKIVDYGTRIRNADPAAKIVGPEEWGWGGLFYSGQDWQSAPCPPDCADRAAHGDEDYLPWLLDQLHQNELSTGKRTLDVFAVHYYPQGANLVFAGDAAETTPAVQRLRNRSTRSLWDPNYLDESWVRFGAGDSGKVRLVPRLKQWVAENYPGLETGITEYNWGAEKHINGATTQADILGIFGREGLDLATRWTTPAATTPTYKAMKMFGNYDGNGSGFGDVSVFAGGPNPDDTAVFAAERTSDNALTVMVVNKVLSGTTPATVKLRNFTATGPAELWQLTSANEIQRKADVAVVNGQLSLTLPAQSISLLVLPDRPLLSIADAVVAEPASGTSTAKLAVSLSVDHAQTVTVDYDTVNGTAQAGSDYGTASGTLTFLPGETSKTLPIILLFDASAEPTETFTVSLSSPSGATVADGEAVVTIVDSASAQKLDLSAARYSTVEGRAARVTVRRSGGASYGLTVNYETLDGSATAADYTPASGQLSFPPGMLTRTLLVQTAQDSLAEGSESLLLRLEAPTGPALLGPQSTAVLTVEDDDRGGTIQFAAPAYSALEGGPPVPMKVLRTGGLAGPLTVSLAVTGGTASNPTDFGPVSALIGFAVGQTSATVPIPIGAVDGVAEGHETAVFTLGNPTGGALLGPRGSTILTVRDADAAFFFASPTVTVRENAAKAAIAVKRSGSLSAAGSVHYVTSGGGTATSGEDYLPAAGTLSFPPGASLRTLVLTLKPDTRVEGDETVVLSLSDASGAVLPLSPQATVTIQDDDQGGQIQFGATFLTVSEKTPFVNLLVKRVGGAASNVSVQYSVTGGTATSGSDFTLASGGLEFGAGVVARTLQVPITNDASAEGPETFTVSLSTAAGGATLGSPSATTVTILDDEPGLPAVQLSTASSLALEPAGPLPGFALVTLKRSGSLTGASSVSLSTSNGTAQAPADYTAQAGLVVSFTPGQKMATVKIPVLPDLLDEPDETFTVSLALLSGAVVTPPFTAVVTIRDNDTAGRIQFPASPWSVREDGGAAVLTVTRSGGTAAGATVGYATSSGTATTADYTPVSGTLTFGAGETAKTVSVPITGDAIVEGVERFTLTLSGPGGGAALGAPVVATVFIVDPE